MSNAQPRLLHSNSSECIVDLKNRLPLPTVKTRDSFIKRLKRRFSTKQEVERPKSSIVPLGSHGLHDVPHYNTTVVDPRTLVQMRHSCDGTPRRHSVIEVQGQVCSASPSEYERALPRSAQMRQSSSRCQSMISSANTHWSVRQSQLPRSLPMYATSTSPPARYWLLAGYAWYWGPLTRSEAIAELAGRPDGTFLVRDSELEHNRFTLTYRCGGQTLNYRIICLQGRYAFLVGELFDSIPDLIVHAMKQSKTGPYCVSRGPDTAGDNEVRLLFPHSRLSTVHSLKFLARFVIRHHTRLASVHYVPVPVQLFAFPEERRFYV